MHCNSDVGFLNSFFNLSVISLIVFGCRVLVENYINDVRALPLNVVVNCALLMSWSCTCLMFHTASHRKKSWLGSSAPVPRKIGSLISSPILLLCKGGFCCTIDGLFCCGCVLDELVYCGYVVRGFTWPLAGIYSVPTQPPWLLPTEVFFPGGEVVCVLLSNKSAGICLRPLLNLSGVFALCLIRNCSVSSTFPINIFPTLARLGSSCIPSKTYRSDLKCNTPLSHNNILIHKFKEFKNLPR